MAFASVGQRIAGGEKVSDDTYAATPSSAIPVGAVAIGLACADALSGSGESTDHTFSDDQSNTWTRIGEISQSDDATTSLWVCVPTTEIGTGDNITLTLASAATAKYMIVWQFSVDGSGVTVETYGAAQANSDAPAASVSGLSSGTEHLLVCAVGNEWTDQFNGTDADYTLAVNGGTTDGTGHENVSLQLDYRIASGLTADTCTASLTAANNWCAVLGALSEVGGGGAGLVNGGLVNAGLIE